MRVHGFFVAVVLTFLLASVNLSSAKGPDILWTQVHGTSSNDVARSVAATSDGGYIIAGWTSYYNGYGDVYLVKTDADGDTLWTRIYRRDTYNQGYAVEQTQDGGYIVVGYTAVSGGSRIYLLKTDAQGDTTWTRTYGSSAHSYGYSVAQTTDGGYIVAGIAVPAAPDAYSRIYLVKTDADGDTLWTRVFGASNYYANDYGHSVRQASDGGYVVAGTKTIPYGPSYEVALIKTDADGDSLWTLTCGGTCQEQGFCVRETGAGEYVVLGRWQYHRLCIASVVYLIKSDAYGDTVWTRTYPGVWVPNARLSWSMEKTTPDNGYIMAGPSSSLGSGRLMKTDANGDSLWTKWFIEESDSDEQCSVELTSDGGYVMAGTLESGPFGARDIYLVKTGQDPSAGVHTADGPRDLGLCLSVNPSPSKGACLIEYTLPSARRVVISLYDVQGRRVSLLQDTYKAEGAHLATWDGRDSDGSPAPEGIYFVRITAGGEVAARKIVFTR
jgi:hypothetical protein